MSVLGSTVGPVLVIGTVTDCSGLIRWQSRDGNGHRDLRSSSTEWIITTGIADELAGTVHAGQRIVLRSMHSPTSRQR
ncbi:hypothetical protein OG394_20240 [Kribbella sp. NBC_01245]|uniref:hypothetical protein n=1 Tax=Kribbella sp. NBC_01245 TaxID=2903578 RepID=UPI002E2B6680|nr:hypothetical protein [Kribbella sp. NBC_01245]